MPAVTRELSITYGSITMGGARNTYLLTGSYNITHGYGNLTVDCQVVVVADTQAAFRSAYIALEDGIREPFQDLTITLGGGSQSFTMGANTGFNHAGVCSRVADSGFDTGMSRIYDVSISCELPADATGDNGLATKTIDVVTDAAGRSTVTIDGSYTALGVNSARAQYDAQIGGLITTTMTALGITQYETIQTDVSEDYANKVANFRAILLEILYPETGSATNDARLKNVRLTISRNETAPGDASATVERPIELTVGYGCDVDSAVTTDLDSLFDDVILPYMVTKAQELTAATSIAVVSRSPNFNRSGNGIEASISVIAYTGGALISHQRLEVDDETYPVRVIPVWDGNPHAKIIEPAEGLITRTIREETVSFQRLGSQPGAPGRAAGGGGIGGGFGLFGAGALDIGAGAGIFGGGAVSLGIQFPAQQGPAAQAGEEQGGQAGPALARPANRAAGMFVPIRTTREVSPLVQGIAPYQVRLERVIEITEAIYIVEPEKGWTPPKPAGSAGEGQESKRVGA